MRVKTAAALLLLGLIALVAGIGQLTFWAPPQTVTATLQADVKAAPLTVIDTKLRSLRGGEADVAIKGDGNFVLAVGRPDDVAAWVGKTAHTTIDGASADGKQLTASFTDGEPSAPSPASADTFATAQNASGSLDYRWDLPDDGDWQLVLATDGTKPAPHDITITWPSNETTPWAVPLIVLGALLLAAAIVLLVIRRGGPGARKPAAEAAAQPGPDAGDSTPGRAERRSARRAASAAVAVVVALVTGAGAAHATTAPSPPGSANPSPASSAASASASAAPAQEKVLVDEQLQRILDQVANAVAAGDQAKDSKQLEPRVGESALLARTQNYKIRASVASAAALSPVRGASLRTSVVTTQRSWPRTVMAVTRGEGNTTPQILTLRQDNARANYKLIEVSPLLPGPAFPNAPKAGAEQLALDAKSGLAYSPNEALRGLGDRLTNGDAWKDKIPENAYIKDTLDYEADVVKTSPNGNLTFTHNPTANDAVAYRTADGGAILVAPLDFTISGTPKSSGDKVTLADDSAAALAGGKEATTKMTLQFRESVVLYIPADGAKGQLTLVGATRNLVGASVS
ncbi:hypothetical protein [Sinomonas sp. ASV322]|uniref:hypothetical protein n=1 Tax=Sinomonas sp. ASV322 TaxID=3041920 RepID=UPI0027DAC5B0|nr:hypothetical protein [Sinomonas sp. ASV322]MDQ4502072.1 hypothetical protein [Sinomonas sp. ASV322]